MPLEKGGELPEFHFKSIVYALWPEDGPKPFVWHLGPSGILRPRAGASTWRSLVAQCYSPRNAIRA